MSAESGTQAQGQAQFWWAENVPADRYPCNVDACDASVDIFRPDIYNTISETISNLDHDLRLLSLDIHGTLTSQYDGNDSAQSSAALGHPELKFQETCVSS
jgi:hypothetical protein